MAASTWTGSGSWARLRLGATLLALLGASGVSCESCSGGGGGGGGGGGPSGSASWLVGRSALMLNITHDGRPDVGDYDLRLQEDLLGIACRGTREAWVVGDGGLLIATDDAGASWRVLDSGSTRPLRAVAVAAPNFVLVAGDGEARLSPDAGRHFRALPVGARSFTSVTLRRADGAVALLASAEGDVQRFDAATGTVTEVARTGAPLRSVVLSRDGQRAIAVGDGGVMLVSADGGLTFSARATGTAHHLRDVWLVGSAGERFVAVGDAGVVLEGALAGGEVAARSLGGFSLRALHMEASGHGMIVGDAGTALFTEDFGASWAAIDTGDTRDILGVDALDFGAAHL